MIVKEQWDILNLDNFEEYLEEIKKTKTYSLVKLPSRDITVKQAKRLYQQYLFFLEGNDFLTNMVNERIKFLNYYPDYWKALDAFDVEGLVLLC